MTRIAFSLSVLLLCMALAFASCSGAPKHPAELATADSLNRVIASIDSAFRTIDTTRVKKAFEQISHDLNYIQYNLKDTLHREEGELLSQIYNVKRALGICSRVSKDLAQKLHTEKEQCSNLAHDLKHNTLSEKLDPKTCVRTERDRVIELSASARILAPSVTQALKTYGEKYTGVEEKVRELKAKGGKEPDATYNKKNEEDGDQD